MYGEVKTKVNRTGSFSFSLCNAHLHKQVHTFITNQTDSSLEPDVQSLSAPIYPEHWNLRAFGILYTCNDQLEVNSVLRDLMMI